MPTTINTSRRIVVDCLQYNNPERERFEEWRRGGIDCVHVTVAIWESARETLMALGKWNRLFDDHADLIGLARTAADIRAIAESGRTAVLFGFQDSSPLEDDIELVQIFHDLGIRIIQLTYNVQNRIASGCWEPEDAGVSKFFGRNVINEMNRLGMLVDVSHCGEKSSSDAVDMSSRPIAITHANPSEFVGTDIELNRRNKSTPLIRRLAERGGVLGLSMYPKIMKGGSNCTLDTFLDMIEWTVDKIGVDSVGFGTDYYDGWPESVIMWWRAGRWSRESAVPIKGFSDWPDWFRSSADFEKLLAAMSDRGFSDSDIDKIAGGNWLRLFEESFVPAA